MNTLDLHGIRHEAARKQTIKFIEDAFGKYNQVEIVTGHSKEMQKIVTQILDEYKLVYHIGGWLGMNPAIINVDID